MRLFFLGLGYSAQPFVRLFGGRFSHIAGTVRDPAQRGDLAEIAKHAFSGSSLARETIERPRAEEARQPNGSEYQASSSSRSPPAAPTLTQSRPSPAFLIQENYAREKHYA